jgi:hypothetical protein
MSCKKFSFNNIANVISIVSGVSLAGIIGAGTFVYINKDAIIDNVKQQAIEAVMGSMGGGLGGSLPTGANDLPVPDNSASIPSSGIPNF